MEEQPGVLDQGPGYYWVIFDYARAGKPGVADHWEVGSWDPFVSAWALIGSKDHWYTFQLKAVGPKIAAPGLPIIELTSKEKKK
jgi:hypothetical protein